MVFFDPLISRRNKLPQITSLSSQSIGAHFCIFNHIFLNQEIDAIVCDLMHTLSIRIESIYGLLLGSSDSIASAGRRLGSFQNFLSLNEGSNCGINLVKK